MFRRKLTVSLPIAILIVLLVVGAVGAAAWFVMSQTNVSLTASSLNVDWNTQECLIYTGSGSITQCDLSGSTVTVGVDGAKIDTEVQLKLKANPVEEPLEFYYHPPAPLPPSIGTITVYKNDGITLLPDGFLRPSGENTPIVVRIDFPNLEASEVVSFSYEFEARQVIP